MVSVTETSDAHKRQGPNGERGCDGGKILERDVRSFEPDWVLQLLQKVKERGGEEIERPQQEGASDDRQPSHSSL